MSVVVISEVFAPAVVAIELVVALGIGSRSSKEMTVWTENSHIQGHRQTDRQIHRQPDRQTDRQTDRQADT